MKRGLVPPAGSPPSLTLDTILWDVETLRTLLQQMTERCQLSPSELFRAWDRDGDKELTRKEWQQTMFHCEPAEAPAGLRFCGMGTCTRGCDAHATPSTE